MQNRTSNNLYKARKIYTRSALGKKSITPTIKEIYKQNLNKVQSRNYLGPSITATHFYIYDSYNDTYFGQKQYQQRQVASLTKIMTTILALELIQRYGLDKQLLIRVSKQSSQMNGTSAKLKQGCFVKLYDLLYGTMLPSGNDAAYLIAQVFGLLLFYENIKPQQKQYVDIQSIDLSYYDNTITFVNRYIKQMNNKARQLKMIKTSFANPHGLVNPLNVSTAKDIMTLSKYSMENKQFAEIVSTKQYDCQLFNEDMENVEVVREWKNTNKLIQMGWQGIKTGQTPAAGCCLASVKNGIFIVLLNSATADTRFDDTIQIYNWYTARNSMSLKQFKQSEQDNQQYFKQFKRQQK